MDDNEKIVRILWGAVIVLCFVYVLGLAYENIRLRYNEAVARNESMTESAEMTENAETSVEVSIAAEEKKSEGEQVQEASPAQSEETAQSEEQAVDETISEAGDVTIPASVTASAHDFAYEIRTDNIPDTYQIEDTTYTLSYYNLYGYDNGRDRWEALFQEKNVVYSFTGYIDTRVNATPRLDALAEEVGLECSFFVLAEQEFDENGRRIKQYHYRLNDKMQKESVLYGYEYDYNSLGQRTEYRYYYNYNRSNTSGNLQLSQRTLYQYDEDGACNFYQEYKSDGTLKKTHIYLRDDSGRGIEKIIMDANDNLLDHEFIYYDDMNAICKTVTSEKVTLYINDEDGNHIVRAVYETE